MCGYVGGRHDCRSVQARSATAAAVRARPGPERGATR